jgi:hypothetical protein
MHIKSQLKPTQDEDPTGFASAPGHKSKVMFQRTLRLSVITKMNRSLEPIRWCLCPLPKSFKGCFRPSGEKDAAVILINLTGELWSACEFWYFQFPIKISAPASPRIFKDIELTFVPAFNFSSSIGRDVPVEDILIKIKCKPWSWRS